MKITLNIIQNITKLNTIWLYLSTEIIDRGKVCWLQIYFSLPGELFLSQGTVKIHSDLLQTSYQGFGISITATRQTSVPVPIHHGYSGHLITDSGKCECQISARRDNNNVQHDWEYQKDGRYGATTPIFTETNEMPLLGNKVMIFT